MTIAILKDKLHGYIEQADEENLQKLYEVASIKDTVNYTYDEETMRMLEERVREYESGKVKGFTIEEAEQQIVNRLKNRNA